MPVGQNLMLGAKEAKKALATALGWGSAGNRLTVLPDDTFLVSYPRSGNTWARFLIGNLIHDTALDFTNINRYIPGIHGHSNRDMLKAPRPRILKSHEMYDARYPKIIYIIRDGRDVAVSYYYYWRKFRKYSEDFDTFVLDFVTGRLDKFGSWGANILSWLGREDEIENGMLVIHYEDMLNDIDTSMARICHFLKLERSSEQIQMAIQKSSFKNMTALETKAEDVAGKLRDSNRDVKFVRAGTSGSWLEEFSPRARESFRDLFGEMLVKLGYEDSLEW